MIQLKATYLGHRIYYNVKKNLWIKETVPFSFLTLSDVINFIEGKSVEIVL